MNNPTNGKANPINGISNNEVIVLTSRPTALGNTKITINIAMIMQALNIQIQLIFLVKKPAANLPTAKEIARILAIIILMFSGKCSTLLLKVGNQDIIPCSIITNKKALITKTIVSNLAISWNICLKSSSRLTPGTST